MLLLLCVFVYIFSYVLASRGGSYKTLAWGPSINEQGEIMASPKGPEKWHPFDLYKHDGSMTVKHVLYWPMVYIDRYFRGEK